MTAMRAIALAVLLAGLWLGLSGHYTPLILSFGVASILISVFFAIRFDVLDREGLPFERLVAFLTYLPWLLKEIAKSNIAVLKAILEPDLKLSPGYVKLRTGCESDLAKATFANSITLTPGTVTVDIDDDVFLVHALFVEGAEPESFAEMEYRSRRAADGPAGLDKPAKGAAA